MRHAGICNLATLIGNKKFKSCTCIDVISYSTLHPSSEPPTSIQSATRCVKPYTVVIMGYLHAFKDYRCAGFLYYTDNLHGNLQVLKIWY